MWTLLNSASDAGLPADKRSLNAPGNDALGEDARRGFYIGADLAVQRVHQRGVLEDLGDNALKVIK